MRPVVPCLVLALAACGKKEAPPAPPAPPAASQANISDFSQPMLARGNEPFWAVKIEGTRFTLSRPDEPDAVFEAPGAMINPGRAVWNAKATDGQTMTLSLYVSECSDGMSDTRYPMAAEVAMAGQTLRGCAVKVSELPRKPAG